MKEEGKKTQEEVPFLTPRRTLMAGLSELEEKLAQSQADLERVRDESSALKALVLLCEEHAGDVDYKAYLSGEISVVKASVATGCVRVRGRG